MILLQDAAEGDLLLVEVNGYSLWRRGPCRYYWSHLLVLDITQDRTGYRLLDARPATSETRIEFRLPWIVDRWVVLPATDGPAVDVLARMGRAQALASFFEQRLESAVMEVVHGRS